MESRKHKNDVKRRMPIFSLNFIVPLRMTLSRRGIATLTLFSGLIFQGDAVQGD
jgi:hypothetical protein